MTYIHRPLILPYILKNISCINNILLEYPSMSSDFWPENKCRSQWPIFHSTVILPYILKNILCININNKSVWSEVWLQNKHRSKCLIFHGPVIFAYILKSILYINIILIMSVWPKIWSMLHTSLCICKRDVDSLKILVSFISKAWCRLAVLSCDSFYYSENKIYDLTSYY